MGEHIPTRFDDGTTYEKMMGRWSRIAGSAFLDFLSPTDGLHWLDAGCGNGAFSELLFRQAKARKVTGIDPSAGMLETARARLADFETEFIEGDAQELPFEDEKFDSAVSALVINFLPDPPKAISEMVRVLRPGGWLSCYTWDMEGGGFTMEPIRVALKQYGVAAPVTGPEKSRCDYMEDIWRTLGVQEIRTTRIEVPLVYGDFQDFWSSNTEIPNSVAKAVAGLKPDDVAALQDSLRASLPTASDGTVRYSAAINAIAGRVAA